MSSPSPSAAASIRAAVSAVGLLGIVAIACLLIAAFVGVRHGVSVLSVLTERDASSNADPAAASAGVERYAASYATNTTRIANRDIWNRPKAPPPPPPPPRTDPVPVVRDNTPPPPPPPPSIYGGPGIIAMMGDTVWFEGGDKLTVGESNDEVEIISTRPPWSATIVWKEVEFEVGYFDRDIPSFWAEPSAGAVFESKRKQPDPDPAEVQPSDPSQATAPEPDTEPESDPDPEQDPSSEQTPEPTPEPGNQGAENPGEPL